MAQKRLKGLKNRIVVLYIAALVFVLVPGTVRSMPWSQDLFDQPSYKAQEDLPPMTPEGIVSTRGKQPEVMTREEAVNLRNPMLPTDESLARGKDIYDIHCAICHGKNGRGDGKVGKKYMSPTDLTSDYIRKLPDGVAYFIITKGGVNEDDEMPGYGDAMSPEDSWHLVNYMKYVLTWW